MIKRFVSFFTALSMTFMLFTSMPIGVSAAEIVANGTCGAAGNEDNVTWTLDSDGVLTISGTGEMAPYSDSSYFGMIISPWRTNYEKDVKSIVIESGITCINSHAFYDCSNITSVSIPNTVTYIGSSAFNSCESLTSIAIPSSVETINWHAFMGCTHLENITIEGTGLQTIGESVFQETIFSSINIPESVTEIEPGAFAATKLTTLKLPSNITSIADSMFFACENLESLIIPDKVESIGIGAFADCPNLEYVLYPAGASLGEYAFANFNEYDEYDNPIDGPTTQLKYEPDGNKRRITEIILGSGKTGVTVTDDMNVSFVAENERSKVSQSGHTHAAADGVCQICNAAVSNHTHKVCDDSNHADCTHSDVEYEPFPSGNNSLNIITSDKNFYLTEDLTDDTLLYDIFIEGTAVNFCLNGHTIITEKKGFTVSDNGVLNICDCKTGGCMTNTLYTEGVAGTGENGTLNIYGGKFCGEKGSGIFTGDNSVTNIYGGEISSAEADCIWLRTGSTLSIYGGTIESTTDKKDCIYTFGNTTININGGTVIGKCYGINLDDSSNTVNIKDGTVIGKDNAAVYAEAGDTINISGGKVLSEKSSGYSISNYGTMNISGGTFGGNTFNYITNYGSLSLRGNPTLTNTGIWLCNDNNITISGTLTNTEAYPIYVSGDVPRTLTSGYDTYMTDKNVSKYFKSPYSYIKIAYRNGEAVKVYYYKITYDANGGSCLLQSSEANGSDKLTSLATPTREGFNFDGWFTKAVGGEQITTDTVFTNDTTIYAHWTCDHIWGDTYENDDAQHWQICTKCGAESEKSDHTWDEGEVTKPSTETEEGEMTYKCTVCSATKTESIDKIHTHTYSPDWSSNETHHWHASTCGHTDAVDGKEEHIFVDGKCKVCQRPDPNYETPTDTSVSETEPPETDPSDTESSDTQPPETDPSDTESSNTQPPETDPSDTESSDTQPPETDPSDTESSDTQPPETDPSDTESSDTQPPVTEPPVTEPTATNPPYIPYYPPSGSHAPTPTVPVSKEPFLQDENGKIGWAVISDDIWATPDGEAVLVNMNGTTELPKNIVSDIAGRDIDLVLIMNRSFTWTINGMSVDRAKTVDMRVRKLSVIPRSTVQEFFGDSKTVQIDLRHNGDFGFTAELTVDLGDKYSGKYANSYCYKSRSFEFGDSAEITDGQTKLRFTHASSWLITIDDFPVLEDVSSASAAHSAETPIDMSNSANGGVTIPEYDKGKNLRFSNKKRRYRILKKRRLDDSVFVY